MTCDEEKRRAILACRFLFFKLTVMKINVILTLATLTLLGCSAPQKDESSSEAIETNPPAPGFNTNSDAKAIEIADQVMEAMGGRKNWDDTRYLFWNFFGVRTLLWDKQSGDVPYRVRKSRPQNSCQ